MSGESFFSRWSRRKHEVARGDTPAEPAEPEEAPALPSASAEPVAPPAVPPPAPLPDVASLTPDSDFTPFMRADVDPTTKAKALKTLFGDPRFNVMDGLDVYIDDYSKPDPLPEGWLEKLEQVSRLGDFREPDPAAASPDGKDGQSSVDPEAHAPRIESASPPRQEPPAPAESPITLAGARNSDPPEE